MAYVTINPNRTDADSIVDQSLMDDIRNDLDDLNTRVGSNEAISDGAIRDDFIGTAYDTDNWDSAGTTAPVPNGQPDHYIHLVNGANGGIIAATTKRARLDLDRDHSFFFEARVRCLPSGTDADMFLGLQDSGLTLVNASITDTSDMIGFVRGTNSNTLKFRTAKATVNSETDNLGNFSAWQIIRITIASVSSGADITVRVYTGSTVAALAEISGSPFTDETKIPLVELRPFFGVLNGGGSRQIDIDYCLAYWTARPLSA